MQSFSEQFEKVEKTPNALGNDISVNPEATGDITGNTTTATENIAGNAATASPLPEIKQGVNMNAAKLIPSDLAVNAFDIIIPTALVLLFKKSMDRVVSKKQFQLNNTEKETLKPCIEACMQSINFNIENPWNALALTAAMIYGMKAIEVINEVPAGKFTPGTPGAANVGEKTAAGTIKKDGRGRPLGSKNKDKK